jgi:cysteine desulfurase
MGEAHRIAKLRCTKKTSASALQQRMLAGLKDVEEVFLERDAEACAARNLNMSFNFVEGESLIMGIRLGRVQRLGLHICQSGAQ